MADGSESGAGSAGTQAGGEAGSAAGGDGQAPGGENQPPPAAPSRLQVNEDLLVLIKKYAMQLGLLVVVWMVGYWAFSVSWIMLGLFVWMWREKRQKAKEFKIKTARKAAQNEQETVLARLEDLPSWVSESLSVFRELLFMVAFRALYFCLCRYVINGRVIRG